MTDIIRVYQAVYGESPQVRDLGLLESSVLRPSVSAFGEQQYPTLSLKAAALLDSLCRNHALVDGNKRCGWIGVRLIYFRNTGKVWTLGDDAAHDLIIEASSTHLDLAELARRLDEGFTSQRSGR
ncbi:type II toxin-antitoxin system death-on-curing family toxin [Gordonia alkaliphila]|uniref:type II toxin-antitoxin system death-on-curing family toxin n=1 Tax=Gordonia alkaliphila TaxID=1053547 RepID=UPI00355822D8